jgi:hypothetical protein
LRMYGLSRDQYQSALEEAYHTIRSLSW